MVAGLTYSVKTNPSEKGMKKLAVYLVLKNQAISDQVATSEGIVFLRKLL
jgi:hypothetical protein